MLSANFDIHSFPAWSSALKGLGGKQAGKFAWCVLGELPDGTYILLRGFIRQVSTRGSYSKPASLCCLLAEATW